MTFRRTPAGLPANEEADFWEWLIDQWESSRPLAASKWERVDTAAEATRAVAPQCLVEGDEFTLLGQPAILLSRGASTVLVGHFDHFGEFRETSLAASTFDSLIFDRPPLGGAHNHLRDL